jgi:hypothetical protein
MDGVAPDSPIAGAGPAGGFGQPVVDHGFMA